jgi:hypothetical protein
VRAAGFSPYNAPILIALLLLLQDAPKIGKGEKAPDFAAKNQAGTEIKLGDFKGN